MFPNARRILRGTKGRSRLMFLIAQASLSRPRLAGPCRSLLRRFARCGRLPFDYLINGRRRHAFLRLEHLGGDLYSAMELAVGNLYRLEKLPKPDLVIDGGANTGLFTLAAAARWPEARIRVCEPVPHNLAIVDEHLRINSVQAEVLPVALGGAAGRATFYCRQANQGSFDPTEPYHSVI